MAPADLDTPQVSAETSSKMLWKAPAAAAAAGKVATLGGCGGCGVADDDGRRRRRRLLTSRSILVSIVRVPKQTPRTNERCRLAPCKQLDCRLPNRHETAVCELYRKLVTVLDGWILQFFVQPASNFYRYDVGSRYGEMPRNQGWY